MYVCVRECMSMLERERERERKGLIVCANGTVHACVHERGR